MPSPLTISELKARIYAFSSHNFGGKTNPDSLLLSQFRRHFVSGMPSPLTISEPTTNLISLLLSQFRRGSLLSLYFACQSTKNRCRIISVMWAFPG